MTSISESKWLKRNTRTTRRHGRRGEEEANTIPELVLCILEYRYNPCLRSQY
jgi:hypothetical protein